MSLNYAFIVDQAQRFGGPKADMLDFGCGRGQLVALARARGLNAQGCDWYNGPWASLYDDVARDPALRDHIGRIGKDGRLPFADGAFDLVTTNQVFEHIAAPAPQLAEISRVLKPGGRLIALFPSREVWHETHVGLPFVHRFGAEAQRRYLGFAYDWKLGMPRAGLTREAWIARAGTMLHDEIHYVSEKDVLSRFGQHFDLMQRGEADWIRYRVAHHPRLRSIGGLLAPRVLDSALRWTCVRAANLVLVLRKKA